MKTIYFAGGCFWGTQKFFDQFDGVLETEVGYANGTTERPSYEDVCYRDTGHAETVKVIYDEEQLSLKQLLRYYFMTIDPTSLNRQGNDRGTQYRTGIYYEGGDPEKADLLKDIGDILEEVKQRYFEPLVVEVLPLDNFFTAEDYHQKYLDKHPFGYCHIPRALLHLDT